MRTVSAMLLIATSLAAMQAAAQAPSPPDNVNEITVYGNDPCPRSTRDEIVVCSRRPETERLRIPPNMREQPPTPNRDSWSKKAERLETMGRTGVNSCSAVGPGGGTGCLAELIKQAREERKALEAEQEKAAK
jgi:hypothetical protein